MIKSSFPIYKNYIIKIIQTTHIQSACKCMYENNVGCLVILKGKMSGLVPVGIITESDIVKIIGSTVRQQ